MTHRHSLLYVVKDENHNIAIIMSSYCADPVLELNILHWLGVFKYLVQCYCTGLELEHGKGTDFGRKKLVGLFLIFYWTSAVGII